MPYRKPSPVDPKRQKKEKELEKLRSLALEGEAKERMRAPREKEREERRKARKEARSAFWNSVKRILFGRASPYYKSAVGSDWLFVLYALAAVACYFIWVMMFKPSPSSWYEFLLVIPPTGMLTFVILLFPVYRIAVNLLLWREEGRLARIPFPLKGYRELLSDEPRRYYGALQIQLRFQENLPDDPALFRGLLAHLKDQEASYHIQSDLLTIKSGSLQLRFQAKGGEKGDTSPLRRYFWKAYRWLLLPLHQTFTVQEASLSRIDK